MHTMFVKSEIFQSALHSKTMTAKKTNENLIKNEYRAEIDGLRAISVIAVIINHYNKDFLPSGYLGVDIFFVISGYVITSSFYRSKIKTLTKLLLDFYLRRIQRLFPALVVFVLISSFLISIVSGNTTSELRTGISSLFGLSNIALFWKSKDYFSQEMVLNPFSHTWSLGVEIQFYIIFPIIIWFSELKNKYTTKKSNFIKIITSFTLISLIIYIFSYGNNQPAAYYLLPSRFWEIASGCILFIVLKDKEKNHSISPLYPFLGIIFIFFLPSIFPVLKTVLIVILACLLLYLLTNESNLYKLLTNKKIVYIGKQSYSLYLYHWMVLSISWYSIGGVYWWSIPFQILIILILGHYSYVLIELPFREKYLIQSKLKFIIGFLITSMFSLIVIIFLDLFLGKMLYASNFSNHDFIPAAKYASRDYPSSYNFLKESKNKKIYFLGDSHRFNTFPSLEKVAVNFGFEDVLLWGYLDDEITRLQNTIGNKDLLVFSTRSYGDKLNKKINLLSSLVELSKDKNIKLILVDDLTPFGNRGDLDFFWKFSFYREGATISLKEARQMRELHSKLLKNYSDQKNIFYFDPLDEICYDQKCNSVINGLLVFADGSPHINQNGKFIFTDFWYKILYEILG